MEMTDEPKFKPEKITVKVGDTVKWKNTSNLVHTVTADPEKAANKENVKLPEGAEPFHSGNINRGETFQHTFNKAGTYQYVCLPHEAQGMIGEVTVEE